MLGQQTKLAKIAYMVQRRRCDTANQEEEEFEASGRTLCEQEDLVREQIHRNLADRAFGGFGEKKDEEKRVRYKKRPEKPRKIHPKEKLRLLR